MDTLYLARYVVPITAPAIEGGGVLVRRGEILEVGPAKKLAAAAPRAELIDFGDDAVLLPPLVNAHTHLELTHFPQWSHALGETASADDFVGWIEHVIRVKRSLKPKQLTTSIEDGIKACLASGTGAVGDILSWFPARKAYRRCPLFGRLYLETLGRDPAHTRHVLRGLGQITREVVCGRLRLGISPHSLYNLSSEYLEDLLSHARRHGLPLAIHIAESREETEFLLHSQGPLVDRLYPFVGWQDMVPMPAGQTPVKYLEAHGGLNPENLLIHGVHVAPQECRAIAHAGATVVLCPRSNARLGVGTAPVSDYLEAGVDLALGTDSPASCDSLSMWDELAFARKAYAGRVDPEMLLRMATRNGACALGLCSDMGSFSSRMSAHFQVVRLNQIPSSDELEEALISAGDALQVRALFLSGRQVFALDS